MVHVVVHGSNLPVRIAARSFVFAASRCAHHGDFLIRPPSALTLWQLDNSLTIALDVCRAFLEPIEYLIGFYPGPGPCHMSHPPLLNLASPAYLCVPAQKNRLEELRRRLLVAEATDGYVPTPIERV